MEIQSIYDDAYLSNASPETLSPSNVDEWRVLFQDFSPCDYCKLYGLSDSCSLHPDSLFCQTCEQNYPTVKKSCSFKNIF